MSLETRGFWHKYRAEIIISGIATVVSLAATVIAATLPTAGLRLLLDIGIGMAIVSLLIGLLFNQKRLVNSRFSALSGLLQNYFGLTAVENQFFRRLAHFSDEKALLARVLVEEVLPNLVARLCKESTAQSGVKQVNLILDSGTTIEPVFKLLMRLGVQLPKDDIALRIYTNNLAGIDEIHKLDPHAFCKLGERNFHLIGGFPLNKYRATTGPETQSFLDALWTGARSSSGSQVTVAVLTANWFIAGLGLEQMAFCARGEGHFEFKKSVIENSDQIVLVAPLGKILPMKTVKDLNELIHDRDGEYSAYSIPTAMKPRVQLLTSYRSPDSVSPLVHLSRMLKNRLQDDGCNNVTLCKCNPQYDPLGPPDLIKVTDLPHEYIRVRAREIYG